MQTQPRLVGITHTWKLSIILGLMNGMLGLVQPGSGNGAMTEPASERSLSQLVTEAELIFSGTVQKVEFSMSQGTESQGGLPYTYVTYRMDQTLKGRSENGTNLTLRFLGGRTPDGRYLEASHMPQFRVNDRDLLFVEGNTQTDCPLVGCRSGRFRILNKGVYADDGRAVVGIHNKGHFLYDNRENGSAIPLTLERVKEAIEKEVTRVYTPQDLEALEPVQSADPGKPGISPPQPEQSPPTVPPTPGMSIDSTREEDRVESEALEQNQGNPVLKKNPSR